MTSADHAELVAARKRIAELGKRAGNPPPGRGLARRRGGTERRYEAIAVIAADGLPVQLATRVPDQPRVTGITEYPAREGKAYRAVGLDACSRRVAGWPIDSSQTAALVTSALDRAIRNRATQPGVVIHSDHAVQYASWAFTGRARATGLLPSMGTTGDCYDNAMTGSFWGRVQAELLSRQRRRTRIELANALSEHLEIYCNRRRRHSSPGMLTPIQHELGIHQTGPAA